MADNEDPLSHFDDQGNARMVDVGGKAVTERTAVAEGWITMAAATLDRIRAGLVAKGDVLGVARIAGIQAAKQTGQLIPLCHPLPLSAVEVDLREDEDSDTPAVRAEATVKTANRTGVEMEALTAVNLALLTVYDMCKAMDRAMEITGVRLVEKSGGRSGHWRRQPG